MPTTQEVLARIDQRFAAERSRIEAGQQAYRAAKGRYFQGLPTHSAVPLADAAPDRAADHPADQAESWLDMGGLPASMRSRLAIDVYDGLSGRGYTITLTARMADGTEWARRANVGLDTEREHGWRPAPAEGI